MGTFFDGLTASVELDDGDRTVLRQLVPHIESEVDALVEHFSTHLGESSSDLRSAVADWLRCSLSEPDQEGTAPPVKQLGSSLAQAGVPPHLMVAAVHGLRSDLHRITETVFGADGPTHRRADEALDRWLDGVLGLLLEQSCQQAEARLQQSLQRERDFVAAVLDTAGALVIVLDAAGHVVRCNRATTELLGYSVDELRGRPAWEVIVPPERSDAARRLFMEVVAGDSEAMGVEIPARSRDGAEHCVAWSATVLPGAAGAAQHLVATGIDVTEHKRAEADLRRAHDELSAAHARLRDEKAKLLQAEKLSSIGLLASGVAHEINNPLSGIMGCVKALRLGQLEAARQEEYLDTVQDGLERIRQTVDSLLGYAREQPPVPSYVDLFEVVTASLRLVRPALRKKNLRVDNGVEVDAAGWVVDRAQITQALVNVLLNAVYASREHGTIRLRWLDDDARVGLQVIDEGGGIPVAIRDKVCDPFFTTKPEGEGTGLGLSTALGILRGNGGDIEIADGPQGAAVCLWLPRRGR